MLRSSSRATRTVRRRLRCRVCRVRPSGSVLLTFPPFVVLRAPSRRQCHGKYLAPAVRRARGVVRVAVAAARANTSAPLSDCTGTVPKQVLWALLHPASGPREQASSGHADGAGGSRRHRRSGAACTGARFKRSNGRARPIAPTHARTGGCVRPMQDSAAIIIARPARAAPSWSPKGAPSATGFTDGSVASNGIR